MNTNNTAIHHASLHRRAFLRRSSTALGVMCLGHTLPAGAAEAHPWLRGRQQVTPLAARPVPCDIQHIVLHRDPAEYSGHPRQTVFAYFGGGEMVVGHNRAPCRYESAADVQHDFAGYHSRAKIIVQRTLDGGKTWPADQEVAVYDETITPEQKEVFLHPQNPVRQEIDMFHPESVLCVGHTFPNPQERKHVCFALRSPDKGRTWEKVPTILPPPPGTSLIRAYGCPVVRMPDGRTLLMPVSQQSTGGGVWIYASTDHGLHWQPLAPVALDKSNTGRFTYWSRIRVHHQFFPHYIDSPQLFAAPKSMPGYGVVDWQREKLDYILLSALSCSPSQTFYLPAQAGIPAEDKHEIRKWLDWGRANIDYLFVRKDLPHWPTPGKVDGSAHILGDRGVVFLFNPNASPASGQFALTKESIGLSGEGEFRIAQEHPVPGPTQTARAGETIRWEVPAQTACVLRIQRMQPKK